jgi:hypothetical protein
MPTPNPGPFSFAHVPASYFGRSADPTLPPIPGASDVDLERLRSAYAQAGAGNDVLARIDEIRRRRRGLTVDAAMRASLADQLLGPAPDDPSAPAQLGRGVVSARQQLLDALNQRQ